MLSHHVERQKHLEIKREYKEGSNSSLTVPALSVFVRPLIITQERTLSSEGETYAVAESEKVSRKENVLEAPHFFVFDALTSFDDNIGTVS